MRLSKRNVSNLSALIVLRFLLLHDTYASCRDLKQYRRSLSGAHAPHVVVVGLIVVVDIAIVEVHVPRVVRVGGIGSRRPVVGRICPVSLRL